VPATRRRRRPKRVPSWSRPTTCCWRTWPGWTRSPCRSPSAPWAPTNRPTASSRPCPTSSMNRRPGTTMSIWGGCGRILS